MRVLQRQRALLYMLTACGHQVSRLQLVKWAFLLCYETLQGRQEKPYSFLPYKYGPFSFVLYRDLNLLRDQGFISDLDDRTLRITSEGRHEGQQLASPLRAAVDSTLAKYSSLPHRDLLSYVYSSYPWFASRSAQCEVLQEDAPRRRAVWTIGCESLSVDGLIDFLLKNRIECVVDVRANPVSRQYGFHKSTLSRLLGQVDIAYVHFPQLGIDREIRARFPSLGQRDALLDTYEQSILELEHEALRSVLAQVLRTPSALLCQEADAAVCHRSRLAARISKKGSLPVVHLEPVTSD